MMHRHFHVIALALTAVTGLSVLFPEDALPAQFYGETALPTENPSSFPDHLTVAGNTLYLVADDGIHGRELWMIDNKGSCALAADVWRGQLGSDPEGLTNAGRWLYFTAATSQFGRTAWVWDSAESQCRMLTIAETGTHLSATHFWGVGRDRLYLLAAGVLESSRLFVSDLGNPEVKPVASLWSQTVQGETPRHAIGRDGLLYYYFSSTLCRSDGTAEGTRTLVDFRGSTDFYLTAGIEALGGGAVFVGFDEEHGREPWFTGEVQRESAPTLLRDIAPGKSSSNISAFSLHQECLFFGADDGEHGGELWVTDGTAQGTRLVKDIYPGQPSSDPHYFVSSGLWIYFVANNGADGPELWRSDGTAEGTTLVADLWPGVQGSHPWRLTSFQDTVYFCANSPTHGEEVFRVNKTTGNAGILKDIVPGPGPSGPHQLTPFGDVLYFTCNDGEHGEELWLTDGTASGTTLAADINPIRFNPPSNPRELTALDDRLVFVVSDRQHGEELWTSDGTPTGTKPVRDIAPGVADASPRFLTPLGDRLFFSAETNTEGKELWCSDGTPGGTALVRDIVEGNESSEPRDFLASQSLLFFTADDGVHGREVWRSDGSGNGTFMLQDIAPGEPGVYLECLVESGADAFFGIKRDEDLWSLWRTDGTREGTVHVGDYSKTEFTSDPGDALQRLPIELTHAPSDDVLFQCKFLAEAVQPSNGDQRATRTVAIGDYVLFAASTDRFGAELWKTDGTPEGTQLVQDMFPGPPSSGPTYLTRFGQDLYFIAEHPTEGRILWRSDGTGRGTDFVHLMNDVGMTYSVLTIEIAALDDRLVLSSLPSADRTSQAENAEVRFIRPVDLARRAGEELYSLRKGPAGSWPRQLTRAGNQVFFTADDGIHGRELWATDGTPAGTRLVLDILGPGDLAPLSR